ncbi:AAA family ATPase [Maridesulfovibrio hydrothermalis]|uniref:Response regulator receiver protein n=1 Tax=Maridesulfovibrio hydrothermalis AM13 = DSM 14728 TaxID=1121451 RepID=L0RBB6_9BACT|nr:cytidylate kinase-like family protein [Maridesulfovibrio hydrothermalis]CCO24049.1 Response regulator receiver protein [Maridesulfovibrio hydrothermalis AM13 = DSM 14728]
MPIITISRGSYSKGKAIAEKVASKLKCECLSRDIVLSSSEEFNIPEIKLVRALHDAPSVLERFTHGKKSYLCYLRKSLLQYALRDNIVYHGLAGHFFLSGIPHVFKLRITADMEDRVQEEMRRENISQDEARHILMKDDDERRKWSMQVYGIDTWDSRSYDMVLHIGLLSVDDAVDIICHAVQKKAFQAKPDSRKNIENMYLSAKVHSTIIGILPDIIVEATDGVVSILVPNAHSVLTDRGLSKITKIAKNVEGVKDVLFVFSQPKNEMINPFHNI